LTKVKLTRRDAAQLCVELPLPTGEQVLVTTRCPNCGAADASLKPDGVLVCYVCGYTTEAMGRCS